ncbi:hypothetical protein PFTANZ_00877 [Plasmodium falciparum Tanzania (2000708)]|uniref:RRM domain-containing protein n=1 Tax=Plasmodium falciparum Tanzania (2000708) TaxID=1036725 RepID=A0A024WE23_PLAFA|nr:hypothetical protein PFTANZ_00877 [Plasmodium falciparum Tanzania (2000708)]
MNETKEDTSDRADEVSLENLSFEKRSFEKLSSEKPSSEKLLSDKLLSEKLLSDKEEDEKKNVIKNKNLKKSNKKIIKKNKKKGKIKKNNSKENQPTTLLSNNDRNKNNHVSNNKSNKPIIISSHIIPPPPPTFKPPPPPPPKEKNKIEKWTLRKNAAYSMNTNIDLPNTTNGNVINNNNNNNNNNFSNILITNQNNNHNLQHIHNNSNRNMQNDNNIINNIGIHSTGTLSVGNNHILGKPSLSLKPLNNHWNINNNYMKKGEPNINMKKLSSVELRHSINYNINTNNKKNDIINNNMMYYNITNNNMDKDKFKNHLQIRHGSYYQNINPINIIKEQEDKNKKNTLLPNSNMNQINKDPIYYMNKASYEYNLKGNVIYPPKFPAVSNFSSNRPYLLKAPSELDESHVYNMKYSYKPKGNKMNTPMSDKKPHNIIVTNIPKDLSAQEIMETFKCVGNVLGADIMLTSKGTHSGRACITFPDFESASLAASQYDGGTLNNQKIKVFVE